MNQQINLYQPIFRKQKIVFSARTLLVLGAGFTVLLLAWTLLIGQRVGTLESELERQRQAESRALAQLTEMQQTAVAREPSAELEARVEALTARRGELRASLAALEDRRPVAEARLRGRFDALARHRPHGLWLTELWLDERGDDLSLRGRALSARLIPEYLQALSGDTLLSGTGFRRIVVEDSEPGPPGVVFFLSTQDETDS